MEIVFLIACINQADALEAIYKATLSHSCYTLISGILIIAIVPIPRAI